MTDLTHVDASGKASMVDISDKAVTQRTAIATAQVRMSVDAFQRVQDNDHKKGDVLQVARIAGIQAAKQCAQLIPLCHPLMLSKVRVDFTLDPDQHTVHIEALCKLAGKTGVEMEALTAASVAALTVFDMCKAVDPAMVISDIKVLHKEGGKRGKWSRSASND